MKDKIQGKEGVCRSQVRKRRPRALVLVQKVSRTNPTGRIGSEEWARRDWVQAGTVHWCLHLFAFAFSSARRCHGDHQQGDSEDPGQGGRPPGSDAASTVRESCCRRGDGMQRDIGCEGLVSKDWAQGQFFEPFTSACFLEAARSCHGHHLSSRTGLPPRVMVQVMGKNT